MGDFRQGVGLIHKLAQLAGTEEFFNRGGNGLGVDQIGRHQIVGFGLVQALFYRPLDTRQTGTELVFHQLAHRTHAAVAQVVDIVHFAMTVTQLHQGGDGYHDVFLAEHETAFFGRTDKGFVQQTAVPAALLHRQQLLLVSAGVELHAADTGEIVALFLEEHAVKQCFNRFFSRRLARAHHAVNGDAGTGFVGSFIGAHGGGNVTAGFHIVDKQRFNLRHTVNIELGQ